MNKYKMLLVIVTALCSLLPTLLYSQSIDTAWVRRYNGPADGSDGAYAIAVDNRGNVYVTGNSYGSGTSIDYATIKYNSAGVQQWVQRYDGSGNADDMALSLAVDGQGNVYVTGNSSGAAGWNDYATIKYNSAGVEQWVQTYDGPGHGFDEAYSLAVDGQNNVYVTGGSWGFLSSYDYATIKYNSAGIQQWVRRYNGPGNDDDIALSLAVDGQGNVYVTGNSSYDYATIKYNSAGVEQWVQRYNGPGNSSDAARSLAVDGQSNVYVTGYSIGSGTDFDYATIKYVQTQGIEEVRGQMQEVRELELYPNPAKIYFTVRLPKTVDHSEIKIFDVTGKVVKELESSGNRELRVSLDGIKNGVYFVRIDNSIQVTKIIVTR